MKAAKALCVTVLLFIVNATQLQASGAAIDFTDTADVPDTFVLDVRRAEACEKASLPGARCLPVRDILAPNKRLPNISGMLWFLGTIGLKGDEHVLLIGDKAREKAFVAGLLFVAGQKKISILKTELKDLTSAKLEPGTSRSKTREQVFKAEMRTGNFILRSELKAMIAASKPLTILDLRTEGEYWGQALRTLRGGHIPGAILGSPADVQKGTVPLIIYGHRTYEGLIGLTSLVARGLNPRVLMEGWAGWAADGGLPVDAATFSAVAQRKKTVPEAKPAASFDRTRLLIAGSILALGAFAAGYFARSLKSGGKA